MTVAPEQGSAVVFGMALTGAGATRPHHLPEAVAALELKLTDDEAATLEKPYSNHGPSWY